MAESKPTVGSLTHSTERQLSDLRKECKALRQEIERVDLVELSKRLAGVERRLGVFGSVGDEVRRVAVLENRVAELKRVREESERWSRQLVALAVGAVLALLGGVVQLVAVGLRKP